MATGKLIPFSTNTVCFVLMVFDFATRPTVFTRLEKSFLFFCGRERETFASLVVLCSRLVQLAENAVRISVLTKQSWWGKHAPPSMSNVVYVPVVAHFWQKLLWNESDFHQCTKLFSQNWTSVCSTIFLNTQRPHFSHSLQIKKYFCVLFHGLMPPAPSDLPTPLAVHKDGGSEVPWPLWPNFQLVSFTNTLGLHV